jgi:hypothetical protein
MRSSVLALVAAVAATLAPLPARAGTAPGPAAADFFGAVQAVRVAGDRAYVVAAAGLVIYDVSDRANPRRLSQLFLGESGSFKLEVSGDTVFVLSGAIVLEKSHLRVVDASDPLAPRLVAEYSDLQEARVQAMLVAGTTLALADANAVLLLDVSDPASPRRTARLPIVSDPEQIVSLAARGSTLFAAWVGLGGDALVGGVTSVDISDPSAPAQTGVFPLEGPPNSIASAGDVLYVGETLTAMLVLDASDPAHLVELSRVEYPFTPGVDVYAEGGRLFTGAPTQDGTAVSVAVFDVSDPRAPERLGASELTCQVVGMDYDPAAGEAFLPCAGAGGTGVSVFAVAADGALAERSTVLTPSVTDAGVSDDGTTFLAASDALYAVRPAGGRAEVLGRLAFPQRALRVQVDGARAYVFTADNTIGTNGVVRIVDVSDPAAMRLLGSIALEDLGLVYTSKRFQAVGDRFYVAERSGMAIYDVSDPAAPSRLGSFRTAGVAENVLVSGGLAYVTALRLEDFVTRVDLYVVDVRKAAKPKLKGKRRGLDSADFVSDLEVRDGRLYLLDAGPGSGFGVVGDGRILVVDVGRKKAPRLLSRQSTNPAGSGYARDLALAGDLAYVADGLDGVTVLSLSGDAPAYSRSIDTPGFAVGVSVDGSGALSVADDNSYQLYAPAALTGTP